MYTVVHLKNNVEKNSGIMKMIIPGLIALALALQRRLCTQQRALLLWQAL